MYVSATSESKMRTERGLFDENRSSCRRTIGRSQTSRIGGYTVKKENI